MIDAVLLDLDDTLLDFHRAEAAALRRTLTHLGIRPTEALCARYSAINRSQWELLERGLLTREQVLCRRFDLLFASMGRTCDSRAVRDVYEGFLAQGHYFVPGAPELLEALFPKYRLYLVSNGTAAVQRGRLASAGIGRYFQDIFLSEQVGHNKPSRAFFDYCFAAAGLDRETCIIVGDSLTSDIQGGRGAGIATCWFNPEGRPARADIPADHEISALSQLPPLLARL